MEGRLAILIPTYNGASCIRDALASIVSAGASADMVEAVYIADDASRDETLEMACSTWTSNIPLRILLADQNLGECRNVNRAMQTVWKDEIEWVLLLHQDDLLVNDWIPIALEELKLHSEAALICCRSIYQAGLAVKVETIKALSDCKEQHSYDVRIHAGNEQSLRNLRYDWFWSSVSGTVIHVPAYLAIGGFHPNLRFAGDNDILCRVFLNGYGVVEVKREGVLKRGHPGTATSRQALDGSDVVGWCYLMHRYIAYAGKLHRTIEYAHRCHLLCRCVARCLLTGSWRTAFFQSKALTIVLQSYIALMVGIDVLIPHQVKGLLIYEHASLEPEREPAFRAVRVTR